VRALVTAETPLIRDTVRRAGASDDPRQVERDLDRLGAAAAVALRGRAAIEGLLLLGRRQGGLAFGHREVEALLLLGDQFGVTLENAMLEEQVRRGDRLASLGTLAAGMAHEIKNPLVSLKTFAQLLPERYDDPEFRSTFGPLIEDEVGRIDGLVGRLLDFARPAKPAMAPVSLHACIADSLRLVAQQAKAKGLAIERRYAAEEDGVSGDERLLRQVFVNLLLNAIDATPSGGALSVLTRLGERPADACRVAPPADRWIVAEVRDTGCGIAPSDRGRVFDPFFTTKPAGTGLGLSVAHGIVSEHQGCIAADSVPGQGSCFRVSLPLRPRRAS
jgi:signal transduction histidine kinase